MLLTLTTRNRPANELSFLLHKHPKRCQSFSLSYGQAHVFYPQATDEQCTAALLLDLDPVGLVRRPHGHGEQGSLEAYVNDRPYVASSFFSVAIAQVFGSALRGTCTGRPELAVTPIPLEASLRVVPCRGGEGLLRALFEPLGYAVEARRLPLDPHFPEWGDSAYFEVDLRRTGTLKELLTHLYVLLPVLDNEKHYWVGKEELEKLLAKGEGWLDAHPEREQIVQRYLKYQRRLINEALSRLTAEEDPDLEAAEEAEAQGEAQLETRVSLNEQRLGAVLGVLREVGAKRILDVGCGEGRLMGLLLKEKAVTHVAGMDVSTRALEIAAERLHLDRMTPKQRERVSLFQGSLTYRDDRLSGFDAACAIEVVEHIDASRLGALERVLFEIARPSVVVLTTPNADYNCRFETLPAGALRHRDHRFEWSRTEFQTWAKAVADRNGYAVRFLPVGPEDASVGAPTQMAVFTK